MVVRMKTLIAEDDFLSRKLMHRFLSQYGECDVTVDGKEAINAFTIALEENTPYDLLCLDIMMPELDGYQVLEEIRKIEAKYHIPKGNEIRIIMTTALNDKRNVEKAFKMGCIAYAGKPIDMVKFKHTLVKTGLLEESMC